MSKLFFRKIARSGECWEWTGCISPDGYGRFANKLAHRLSYEHHVGAIPAGLCVCHTCDNRKCVNPAHLFLGTPADNSSDMVRKGRSPNNSGESHPQAKLTDTDVMELVRSYRGGERVKDLAQRYGLSRHYVSRLVNGRVRAD